MDKYTIIMKILKENKNRNTTREKCRKVYKNGII